MKAVCDVVSECVGATQLELPGNDENQVQLSGRKNFQCLFFLMKIGRR